MTTTTSTSTTLCLAEVWVPTPSGQWELVEGSYGEDADLRPDISLRDGPDGLPAAVAAAGKPVIISDATVEFSLRGKAQTDLDGLIGIPTFDQGALSAVLVLGIAARGGKAGLEVWGGREDSYELSLLDGVHPGLGTFASVSRHVHMPLGSGLPGRAWSSGLPQLMRDIGTSRRFLRSSGADSQGLHTGLALPVIDGHHLQGVATLLSSAHSPLVRAYEVWTIDANASSPRMHCQARHDGDCHELDGAARRLSVQPGHGLVGRTWAARRPLVWDCLADNDFVRQEEAATDGITSALSYPVLLEQDVRAVAVLLW